MDNPFCGTSASLAEAGHSNEEATCRHQTSHDLALIDPGLFPGQARSAARGVRHQPKSLFGISRNQRSGSSEISVRLAPKCPFGFARPTQLEGAEVLERAGIEAYTDWALGHPAFARFASRDPERERFIRSC